MKNDVKYDIARNWISRAMFVELAFDQKGECLESEHRAGRFISRQRHYCHTYHKALVGSESVVGEAGVGVLFWICLRQKKGKKHVNSLKTLDLFEEKKGKKACEFIEDFGLVCGKKRKESS